MKIPIKNNQNDLEEEMAKKAERREQKKRKRMKVSGKKVFELKKIIEEKQE